MQLPFKKTTTSLDNTIHYLGKNMGYQALKVKFKQTDPISNMSSSEKTILIIHSLCTYNFIHYKHWRENSIYEVLLRPLTPTTKSFFTASKH